MEEFSMSRYEIPVTVFSAKKNGPSIGPSNYEKELECWVTVVEQFVSQYEE
jgi:hypothetical protein